MPHDHAGTLLVIVLFAYFLMWLIALVFCVGHYETRRKHRQWGLWTLLLTVAAPILGMVSQVIYNSSHPSSGIDALSGMDRMFNFIGVILITVGIPTPVAFFTNALLFLSKSRDA